MHPPETPPDETRLARAVRRADGTAPKSRRAADPERSGTAAGRAGARRAGRETTRIAAEHREQHRGANWLRDVILGGQDGLVNILGIILGVIAGGGSTTVLLVTGIAAAITESISMGAVGYTSTVSERDYYRAERGREEREIDEVPEVERHEIREIYAEKGFSGELLDQVVDTITANRDKWLETMMDEELHLQPVENADIVRSAVVITLATLVGHLIPLVPFFVLARVPALVAAFILSAIVLFAVGVYSAKTLVGDWRKMGVQMLLIGLGAAALGYAISSLFRVAGSG